MSLAALRRAEHSDLPALIALQRAAYARNRDLLGVEPRPLLADYGEIFAAHEIWLAEDGLALAGALIVQVRQDDLLIWSVAVAPAAQGRGIGGRLLATAEQRAVEAGRTRVRLYTGEKLAANVAWYRRHGYAVESVEQLPDRIVVHMGKTLA